MRLEAVYETRPNLDPIIHHNHVLFKVKWYIDTPKKLTSDWYAQRSKNLFYFYSLCDTANTNCFCMLFDFIREYFIWSEF